MNLVDFDAHNCELNLVTNWPAPRNICFLKTINYIEVQKYLYGINGLIRKLTAKMLHLPSNHNHFFMKGQSNYCATGQADETGKIRMRQRFNLKIRDRGPPRAQQEKIFSERGHISTSNPAEDWALWADMSSNKIILFLRQIFKGTRNFFKQYVLLQHIAYLRIFKSS